MLFKNWNPVVKALTEATPYTSLYPNFAGDALETWVFGSRVTLVGDAAHAHGGAFAAGGSLALDDAFALALAFRSIHDLSKAENIKGALRLYERTRQPHTDRLLKNVHGQLDASRKVGPPVSPEEEDARLLERMRNRPDTVWLSEHDVEAEFAVVLQEAEKQKKGSVAWGTVGVANRGPIILQAQASKL
jgi:salicylate hydroxylase